MQLSAIQSAIAAARLRRLAAVRLPRPQRAGPPRPRPGSRRHAVAPLVLLHPRRGRAAQAGPPHRAARPRRLPRFARRSTCAGRNWRPASRDWSRGTARRDGVRAAQRQSLCLARRCRHRRAGPHRAAPRSFPPAIWCRCSRPPGTTSSGRCTWRRPSTRARPTMSPGASSPSASARTARSTSWKCSSASSIISPSTRWSATIRRSCAVGPHSGDPHYEPRPGADGTIREGDFVLIDLWAKLDKPQRRLQRSDLDRLRRHARCRQRYTEIFQHRGRRRATPPSPRVRDAFAEQRTAAGLAGRSGGARRDRTRPATARRSATAPATPSARRRTATGPTWTTWKRARSGACCRGPASRSSRASICRSSACAAK